jgi:hypothetical protein
MVLRKDLNQSNRCCRESLAQRVGISLDQSPARIAPALLLCHLPSRLDFAAGFVRVGPQRRWSAQVSLGFGFPIWLLNLTT